MEDNNINSNPNQTQTPNPTIQESLAPQQQNPQYQQPPMQPIAPMNKKKYLLISIIIAAVLIVVIGIVTASIYIVNQNNKPAPAAISYTKVSVGDVTYSIPEDYDYSVSSDELYLSDDIDTWQGLIKIKEGSYSSLSESKIKSSLAGSDFDSIQVDKSNYSNREYYVIKAIADEEEYVAAITKADGSNLFLVEIQTTDGKPNLPLFNKITSVLDKAAISISANNITIRNSTILDNVSLD